MLQVIREYAAEQLTASGEADSIKDRHAAAYLSLAEQVAPKLFGAEQKKWLDRLELDQDNVRTAFDWSVSRGDAVLALNLGAAFWRFWQMRGHLSEGRMRLDTILRMPGAQDRPGDRARALEAAGGVAYWQGDMEAAEAYYDECLELTRATGDERAIAGALYNDSFPSNVMRRDLPKGQALLDEAVAIYRRLGDEAGIARCLWGLGQIYYYLESNDRAINAIEEAIDLFRRLDDRFGLGWALFVRASIALKTDDTETAGSVDREALKFFADARDVTGVVLVLEAMAEVARRRGTSLRAERLAGAAAAQEATSGAGLGTVVGTREGWRRGAALSDAEAGARADGHAMTLEQAVAYALADEGLELEAREA